MNRNLRDKINIAWKPFAILIVLSSLYTVYYVGILDSNLRVVIAGIFAISAIIKSIMYGLDEE